MKSWAVTRGPSLVPGEKRLAVQVEDHPIDYNKFEGTIPQGRIWRRHGHDLGPRHAGSRNTTRTRVWPRAIWHFTLDGEKLSGGWHLVRMHRRPGEKRDNWLLIKQTRRGRAHRKEKDILEEKPLSVATGRTHGRDRHGPKKAMAQQSHSDGRQARKPRRKARAASRANARRSRKVGKAQ